MIKRSDSLEDKLNVLNDAEKQLKLWNMYKDYYHKSYSSPEEDEKRAQIFLNNVVFVTKENDHLKHSENPYELGVNRLSSMTVEEVRHNYTGLKLPSEEEESEVPIFNDSSVASKRALLKDFLDYRPYMNPIENQGSCGFVLK
jgi:hypothetical protein